jgi:shikimate dehydrogenase
MSDRYWVIGNPVAHSRSPAIHAAFARQTGQEICYERCLAPLDGFAATVRALAAQGGKGANVTVPFKIEAFDLCDRLSARARAAGAVNTLVFGRGGIEGDNTDGAGLVNDIAGNAGMALGGKRILLLGAGGAARGAILPLLEQAPASIVVANRTVARAQALLQDFGRPGLSACGFESVPAAPFDLVVNATSASLAAELPPLDPAIFGTNTLALDMMYGRDPTVFMQFAAKHGAQVRDGLGMLVEQAAEAFALWRGVRPVTGDVLQELRKTL